MSCAPSEHSGHSGHPPSLISLSWVLSGKLLHADSEDSDQTGQIPRMNCVFPGLLVLSCCGSYIQWPNGCPGGLPSKTTLISEIICNSHWHGIIPLITISLPTLSTKQQLAKVAVNPHCQPSQLTAVLDTSCQPSQVTAVLDSGCQSSQLTAVLDPGCQPSQLSAVLALAVSQANWQQYWTLAVRQASWQQY